MVKPYELLGYFLQRKDDFQDIDDFLITLGGLCGYACQMAAKVEKTTFFAVKAAGKNYFFGDGLNYYLLQSRNSFIQIIKNKFESMLPGEEFPDFVKMMKNVAGNIGNKDYKINNLFNPEDKFSYYLEIWNKIFDVIKRNCNKPEGWPILLTLTLVEFMQIYTKNYGKEKMISLLPTILENACYVSKIMV